MADDTKTDTTKAPASKSPILSGRMVKYVAGTAHERVITKREWAAIDVDNETTVWDASNRYALPVEDFSEGALEYLDKADAGFVVQRPKD